MAAIIRACQSGELPATVQVVVAPKDGLDALETARSFEIPVAIAPPDQDCYGERLAEALKGCDIVCLAGYLRLLPSQVLEQFPGKVLNVHPALLPKFGGKGMYGMRVHEAVLESGERESGATVHIVDDRYDEGQILVQRRCPVMPDDTPQSLAARVLKEEHLAYVEALRKLLS
jgi:phosphoribosylglycinamide formyltransferase 1